MTTAYKDEELIINKEGTSAVFRSGDDVYIHFDMHDVDKFDISKSTNLEKITASDFETIKVRYKRI